MENDIVARLRAWVPCYLSDTDIALDMTAAADEIERLHRDYSCICSEMRRMMEERDEARREVCNLLWQKWNGSETEIANQRGWDCYKENTDER